MARILVIDDTKNIRKMVQLALTSDGHAVATAEDGASGLELFGDGSAWDLTLVDQRMPQLEGREFVRAAGSRWRAARIVMMTAFATADLALEILQAGALDFLRKPFSVDVLRGAVKTALNFPHEPRASVDDSAEDSHETHNLPLPGEEGYHIPRVSWRANGFSFWPVVTHFPAPETAAGLELGRVFQVLLPGGSVRTCFVGLAPHVREQVQREAGRDFPDDDPVWDTLCGEFLLRYVWEKAEAPPAVLAVYEPVVRLQNGTQAAVIWGPFTRG